MGTVGLSYNHYHLSYFIPNSWAPPFQHKSVAGGSQQRLFTAVTAAGVCLESRIITISPILVINPIRHVFAISVAKLLLFNLLLKNIYGYFHIIEGGVFSEINFQGSP